MAKNNGGPAFPRPMGFNGLTDPQEHCSNDGQPGMSLRDYFAAKAMHAELNTAGAFTGPAEALARAAERAGQTVEQRIAFNAYRMADAMLEERKK